MITAEAEEEEEMEVIEGKDASSVDKTVISLANAPILENRATIIEAQGDRTIETTTEATKSQTMREPAHPKREATEKEVHQVQFPPAKTKGKDQCLAQGLQCVTKRKKKAQEGETPVQAAAAAMTEEKAGNAVEAEARNCARERGEFRGAPALADG